MDSELIKVTKEVLQAELRSDVPAMERLLTDDFVGVGPRGFVLDKAGWLQGHKTHDLQYQDMTQDELNAHIYGDSAVITKHQSNRATFKGNDVSGEFRVMQVLVKQDGNWRLASAQLSPIMAPPPLPNGR